MIVIMSDIFTLDPNRVWNSYASLTLQNLFERLTYDLFRYVGPTQEAIDSFQKKK